MLLPGPPQAWGWLPKAEPESPGEVLLTSPQRRWPEFLRHTGPKGQVGIRLGFLLRRLWQRESRRLIHS